MAKRCFEQRGKKVWDTREIGKEQCSDIAMGLTSYVEGVNYKQNNTVSKAAELWMNKERIKPRMRGFRQLNLVFHKFQPSQHLTCTDFL